MKLLLILLLSGWYVLEIHQFHKRHCKHFKVVATLIITKDGKMKIKFDAPATTVPNIVKRTLSFQDGPNAVSVDFLGTDASSAMTGDLVGPYTVSQQVAATLTQTDLLGTVSPATPFDFTLLGDVVPAPDATGIVATLLP